MSGHRQGHGKLAKFSLYFFSFLGILGLFYYFFLAPWLVEMRQASAGHIFQDLLPETADLEKTNLAAVEQELTQKAESLLLSKDEIGQLSLLVTQLVEKDDLGLVRFAPKLAATDNEILTRINFELDLKGPFPRILNFLYRLSVAPRLFIVDELSLSNPKMIAGEMIVEVSLAGRTFSKQLAPDSPLKAGVQ